MLSKEEITRQDLGDYKVMTSILEIFNTMEGWIISICTQEQPYEGCPRGHIGHLHNFTGAPSEIYEFADKLYGSYLEEIDFRRSR